MAIAGGATTAYKCKLENGSLVVAPTTKLRSECKSPQEALPLLTAGEEVTVAGSDMHELRLMVAAAQMDKLNGEG
jgi:hypothetical protein